MAGLTITSAFYLAISLSDGVQHSLPSPACSSRRSDTLSVTAAEIEAKFGVTVTQVVAEFGTDGAEEKVIKACEGKQVDLYVGNHAGTNVIGDQGDAKPWIKQPLDFHLKLTDITYISQVSPLGPPHLQEGRSLRDTVLPWARL